MAYESVGATWIDYSENTCPAGSFKKSSGVTRCVSLATGDKITGLAAVDKAVSDLIEAWWSNGGTQVVPKGGTWEGTWDWPDYGGCAAGFVKPSPTSECIPKTSMPKADPKTGYFRQSGLNYVTDYGGCPTGQFKDSRGVCQVIPAGSSVIKATAPSAIVIQGNAPPPSVANTAGSDCKLKGGSPRYNNDGTFKECYMPPPKKADVYYTSPDGEKTKIEPGMVIVDGKVVNADTGLGTPKQAGMFGSNLTLFLGIGAAIGLGVYVYKKRKGKPIPSISFGGKK